MSKNKPNKKETKDVPFDFITEIKMLNFSVTVKDEELGRLSIKYKKLQDDKLKLDGEYYKLLEDFVLMREDQKTSGLLKEQLENTNKQLFQAEENMATMKKEHEEEKDNLIHKYETEIIKYKSQIDSFYKKMEQYNTLYNLSQRQDETIKQLETEKLLIKKEAEDAVQSNFVKNEIKFSNLKNKMLDNIKEMQKNVSQLNIEYMDASSKLTLLQNHQLLIELEYQTQEVEELYKKKEALEKRVFELTNDLEIHKEVEKKLAEKNRRLREFVQSEEEKDNLNLHNDSSSTRKLAKSVVINYTNISSASTYDTRISKLENGLKKRDIEFKILKNRYDILHENKTTTDKKFFGLYKLFEAGLNYLSEINEDEENIIQGDFSDGDFTNLNINEKYTILTLLINFLLPLISPEYLQQNLGESEKFLFVEKNKNDPLLKKIFPFWKKPGDVNISVMNPVKRTNDGLPIISNSRYKL
jgi:hypothetical protein